MAKNKGELQAELKASNKRIAKLSQCNQNANGNINNDETPSWLKTFLEAQLSIQRQTQNKMSIVRDKCNLKVSDKCTNNPTILQQQLLQSANSERRKSRKQTYDVNSSNNKVRRTKADAQKLSTLQVENSLAEFSKWRKSYNDYATVSLATQLVSWSGQLALLRGFFRRTYEKP